MKKEKLRRIAALHKDASDGDATQAAPRLRNATESSYALIRDAANQLLTAK